MIETQTTQARMDESSRCRERAWLSMEDEKRFGVQNPIEAGVNSGELVNQEWVASNAPFDQLIHIGQNVHLHDDRFVGLITKIFLGASGQVSHLAVQTARIFGRHKMVPIQSVKDVTSSRVQLSINYEQFRNLSNYHSDATIAEDVNRALWNDVVLRDTDYYQVNVRVRDGIATLNGHVITNMNQWRVETAVKSIPGVLGIKSYIVPDDTLTLIVAEALGQIGQGEQCTFFPKIESGLAVLFGEVSSIALRDQAEQCVAEIPWVRGVINEIRVTGTRIEPGDQRFLQPLIGRELIFKDALPATIRKVVINPRDRLVVAIVVIGRFPKPLPQKPNSTYPENNPERMVVLPVRLISALTSSGGLIQINSGETAQYEDYIPSHYHTPTQDWLPPYPYCTDEVLFLVESQAIQDRRKKWKDNL